MSYLIKSINYCPVKSLSFQNIKSCNIKKGLGLENDRIFAFSRGTDIDKSKIIENNPKDRKLNDLLTLRNTPSLNKYNFNYISNKLTLTRLNEEIISISPDYIKERSLLSNKLMDIEKSITKPIHLLKNSKFPFFDTTSSNEVFNSISLININTLNDFENKIDNKIELQRFRANFYVEGVNAWEERNWIGKIIKINNIAFKVEENIPRCVTINLKPKTEDNSLNLLKSLKANYNHFDIGIYLTALEEGQINVGDKLVLKNLT